MNIDPQDKMINKERMEKYILRKAFDTTDEPETEAYLPDKILWRQKEQFSDGVGYGWIDALKENAEQQVTDEMMKNPKPEWGDDIPDSKEAYVEMSIGLDMLLTTSQVLVSYYVRSAFPSLLCINGHALDTNMVQANGPEWKV